jgi:membrane protein DedA with SNARE-associated domain
MRLGRFVLLTAIGSGVWNSLFIGGGYLLGSRWQQVERYSHWFDWAIAAVFVGMIAGWVVKKMRKRAAAR